MKKTSIIALVVLSACSPGKIPADKAAKHSFPKPVDTQSREISYQDRKIYQIDDVGATNRFPSARLNNFEKVNDSTYRATISPENEPINPSPWYAFKLWSATEKEVYIELNYSSHAHRYNPKISLDGNEWVALDSTQVVLAKDSVNATMKLSISKDTLWIAAQEIHDHKKVGLWASTLAEKESVIFGSAGKSPEERSLYFLDISNGEVKDKPAVCIISRQHPPEVTGYLAMQAFVETIIEKGSKNGFLDQFRVMVYPLMNPDGVDLGHYRHNTGGVDLNRDWANYHQPEVRQVADHMVKETSLNNNEVVLGLDFHSTYEDVYYTFDDSIEPKHAGFTKKWMKRIQNDLGLEDINESPSGLGSPVSKGWFYQQFNVESITYEIGDSTPRDFIKVKGEVSAIAMMDILMEMVDK